MRRKRRPSGKIPIEGLVFYAPLTIDEDPVAPRGIISNNLSSNIDHTRVQAAFTDSSSFVKYDAQLPLSNSFTICGLIRSLGYDNHYFGLTSDAEKLFLKSGLSWELDYLNEGASVNRIPLVTGNAPLSLEFVALRVNIPAEGTIEVKFDIPVLEISTETAIPWTGPIDFNDWQPMIGWMENQDGFFFNYLTVWDRVLSQDDINLLAKRYGIPPGF